MNFQSICLDAIETVLAWDPPDEVLADTATEQARLMARLDPDGEGMADCAASPSITTPHPPYPISPEPIRRSVIARRDSCVRRLVVHPF